MALKHDLDTESDFLDLEIELLTRNENDEISEYIIEILEKHHVLHWREISKLVRERYTVSIERLQNILRELVYSEKIIELPCRFFTLRHILENIRINGLVALIERKVKELNLSRCSPPLASSRHPFKFRISRSNDKYNKLTLIMNSLEEL